MKSLAQFYPEGLGFGSKQESLGHIGFQVGPVYLGFEPVTDTAAKGATTLWFTVDDKEGTQERLVEVSAEVKYGPKRKPWDGYLAAIRELDGNLLGLSQ